MGRAAAPEQLGVRLPELNAASNRIPHCDDYEMAEVGKMRDLFIGLRKV